jgi:2-haloacid dehalogenase
MKYKFLLFDADGTLLDFKKSEDEALKEALAKRGIIADDDTVATYSKINKGLWEQLERGEIEKKVLLYKRFELFFKAIGADFDAKEMAKDYMNALSQKGYVLEGAEDMCRHLYGNAKMYIVTNGVEFIQRGRYARCGIDKYFEEVFISDVIGVEKPAREYFDHVAAHIDGFEKSKALVIGDSLTSDIKGGINYGIDTCWYEPTGKSAPADMPITFVARSFDEVTKFILGEE